MATASATRSSRSTRMITSAASDEALAPRAPIAMPTLAAANTAASLMPSPTIRVGCTCWSWTTTSTFSAGSRVWTTASISRAAPPLESGSQAFAHFGGRIEREATGDGGGHYRNRDDVVGGLLQRGGQAQHLVRVLARRCFDRDQPRAADGEGSHLVEDDGMGP